MSELPFLTGEQGRGPLLVTLFFISAALVTVWGIWGGTLPASDEAVLAESAREILVEDEVWMMHFDGKPIYDTPPLALWLMAFTMRIFGTGELGACLPFVIFSVLTFYLVFLAGGVKAGEGPSRQWITRPRAVGFLSAIILAASPLFGKFAPHIVLDVPFAFFVMLSILGWLYLPDRPIGLVLWGAGIAGGILSSGAGVALLIPGSLLALVTDRKRRALWRSPAFILVTVAALAVGGSWLVPATLRGAAGFRESPLWVLICGIAHPPSGAVAGILRSVKELWLRNVPWSIPATLAVIRVLFFRKRGSGRIGLSELDDTLLAFSVMIFFPVALARSGQQSALLPLLPIAAILSAREIARWTESETEAGRSEGESSGVKKLWSLNQAMTAIFCLLMLLLFATPLRLHRANVDPIKDIARMARRLTPEGTRLGNFRQQYRWQAARLLFYGNRSLEPVSTEPEEVLRLLEKTPDMVFLASAVDLDILRRSAVFPYKVNVLYRAGELVLFGAGEGM